MDPVSGIAGVLAILAGLKTAVDQACKFWKAPAEMQELAEKLGYLRALADSLSARIGTTTLAKVDPLIFGKPHRRLKRVEGDFYGCFSSQSNSNPLTQYKRSTWFIHRVKIKAMIKEIMTITTEFNLAICLFSSHPCLHKDYALETLPQFYPEQYVTNGALNEPLLIFSGIEISRANNTRVDRYYVMFAHNARHWKKVVVTTTTAIPRETNESAYVNESGHPFEPKNYYAGFIMTILPGKLHSDLKRFLKQTELSDPVTCLSLVLQPHDQSISKLDRRNECLSESLLQEGSKFIPTIMQRGLPRYYEQQICIVKRVQKCYYLSTCRGQGCVLRRLPFAATDGSGRNLTDEFWEGLRLLLAAQGILGIPKFVGVVLSDDRQQLVGYLTSFAEQGPIRHVLNMAVTSGETIPWSRRERWIRQLITATAEVHL